jgi:hypothetical protein
MIKRFVHWVTTWLQWWFGPKPQITEGPKRPVPEDSLGFIAVDDAATRDTLEGRYVLVFRTRNHAADWNRRKQRKRNRIFEVSAAEPLRFKELEIYDENEPIEASQPGKHAFPKVEFAVRPLVNGYPEIEEDIPTFLVDSYLNLQHTVKVWREVP